MSLSSLLVYFCASFLLCVGLTPLIQKIALHRGWIARPSDARWHQKPTALMGGIAIFLAMALPLLTMSEFVSVWQNIVDGGTTLPSLGATVFIGAAFLFAMGLFDDFKNIKPQNKLIGQLIAASIVVFLGYRLNWFLSSTLDIMATLFWIITITNAFNIIDNMDGLCAGVSCVASVVLVLLCYTVAPDAALVASVITGASLGFLIYNFNPAKIFMGDCGSLVLGFTFSVLILGYSEKASVSTPVVIAVSILILIVPIMDMALVVLTRILSGREIYIGGRDHMSHRLVLLGFSEKKAVLLLYGVGCISGLAAIFVSRCSSLMF